jgi:hypothetical protein
MKTMLLAAAAGLSLVASTAAYADGGQGTEPNTFFTQVPGVVAQADVPNAPTYAQNGQGVHVYVGRSNQRTWLFPPNANQGANS